MEGLGFGTERASTFRSRKGGRVLRGTLPVGPNGRSLCRWCSKEVERGRFTFCSAECVHEWKLRTQPAYLRQQVFERDKGHCSLCGVDTMKAHRSLRRSKGERRAEKLQFWGMTASWRKSLWDADHIVPVVEGGGECDLNNVRTLCLRCHVEATARLRQRLRAKQRLVSEAEAT